MNKKKKMIEAFSVPLVNSDGGPCNDMWSTIWERITRLRGKIYSLPRGSIARQFTSLYQIEVEAFGSRVKPSEAFICFPLLILQKDKNIKKTRDIRSLLKRRMQMWNEGLFEELVSEAERCDRKLPKSSAAGKMDDDKEAKNFSSLILQGRLREAVQFITERQGGGVMQSDYDAAKPAGNHLLKFCSKNIQSKESQMRKTSCPVKNFSFN